MLMHGRVLDEHPHPRHGRQLARERAGHLVGAHGPLRAVLEVQDQPALVRGPALPAATDGRHEAVDVGILRHDGGRRALVLHHGVVAGALGRLGRDVELALVLGRDEALGHDPEEHDRADQDQRAERQGQPPMVHHPREGPLVPGQRADPGPLDRLVEPAVPLLAVVRLEPAAAEHRRERERDEARDQDRHRDGDREFLEEPADETAQEEHRDEHRHQGDRHRDDGEGDLAAALDGRLEHRLALLDVADDVLQHHDGVVHHEAHREGERHQRQVVEAVPQQVHHRERARRWTSEARGWGSRWRACSGERGRSPSPRGRAPGRA